jgi:hypothetical protein
VILLGLLLALTTAGSAAAALRPRRWSTFALTAYVVLAAQVVVAVESLSLFSAVTTAKFVAVEGILALASVALLGRRRPTLPPLRAAVAAARAGAADHPLLAWFAVAVALAVLYELTLAVLTPPNNWDSMTYHLSRAAAWYQQHKVDYVRAHTQRENVNPPNAEILVFASLLIAHGDRLAATWQWLAQLASLCSVYLVSLRLGASRAAALFAALVFATLSDVALQATTTQNDLLTASFVAAAIAFLCTDEPHRELLAASALGLALGTKLTAVFALPAVALIAAVLVPSRRWVHLAAATVALGVVLGGFGFVLNLVHTGSLLGHDPENRAELVRSVVDPLKTLVLTLLSIVFDPNGLGGGEANEDSSYFGPLGAIVIVPVVVGTLAAAARRRPRCSLSTALAASLPVYLVALAVTYRFNPWVGRFLLTPIALVAPLASTVYGRRRYAAVVAVVGTAALGASLLIDYAKPSGIDGRRSIWSMPRPVAQAVPRPPLRRLLVVLDRRVPRSASVMAVLNGDDWDYPLYGRRLSRRVVERDGPRLGAEAAAANVQWILVRRHVGRIPNGWRTIPFPHTGLLLACAPSPPCTRASR